MKSLFFLAIAIFGLTAISAKAEFYVAEERILADNEMGITHWGKRLFSDGSGSILIFHRTQFPENVASGAGYLTKMHYNMPPREQRMAGLPADYVPLHDLFVHTSYPEAAKAKSRVRFQLVCGHFMSRSLAEGREHSQSMAKNTPTVPEADYYIELVSKADYLNAKNIQRKDRVSRCYVDRMEEVMKK